MGIGIYEGLPFTFALIGTLSEEREHKFEKLLLVNDEVIPNHRFNNLISLLLTMQYKEE